MDAMKWDDNTMKVIDPLPGEMNPVSSPQNVHFALSCSLIATSSNSYGTKTELHT